MAKRKQLMAEENIDSGEKISHGKKVLSHGK